MCFMEGCYREFVDALPRHLKAHCAAPRYGDYSAQDQAVWRTACAKLAEVLAPVAVPQALSGFQATGLSPHRIPRIEAIDAALRRFGWRAVTVDGFIPPRAFMTFQARRILPVSRSIRRLEHLDYTPAPDIVHEAAGHAPMLASPRYRAFLERLGGAGMRAPARALDHAIYRAQRRLSLLSERQDCVPRAARDAAAVEQRLAQLREDQRSSTPSPACRIARLHWWTVEYGLIGADAKAFGAGLLSSAQEAAAVPATERRRLSAACMDEAYDISRRQRFLYVADDWDHLDAVLTDCVAKTAPTRGGRRTRV